ncbi:hypothetical protein [Streptomyces sp. NPDC001340]
MTEGWATVVAAGIGFAGLFIGLLVGRQQAKDQAQVEHGQWLRDQRQSAYADFLTAWDAVGKELNQMEETWDAWTTVHDPNYPGDVEEAIKDRMTNHLIPVFAPVRLALERVQLLGPEEIDSASEVMFDGLADLGGLLVVQVGQEDWPNYHRAREDVRATRQAFLDAARKVTREAPAPGRPRLLLWSR